MSGWFVLGMKAFQEARVKFPKIHSEWQAGASQGTRTGELVKHVKEKQEELLFLFF